MATHEQLNLLSQDEARTISECCGLKLGPRMVLSDPLRMLTTCLAKLNTFWWSLDAEDWLAAFRSHPQIVELRRKSTEQGPKMVGTRTSRNT